MSRKAAFYPTWLQWAPPLSVGAMFGSGIGLLNSRQNWVTCLESAIFVLALIVFFVALIERMKFRAAAREEAFRTGVDPSDIVFL